MVSLVIFDCDGVLVDSEMLSAGILKSMLAEIGMVFSDADIREDFLGRSFAAAALRAEQRRGVKLPKDFQLHYRERLLSHMETALKPMPGIEKLLQKMAVPFCLATSSSPQRLAATMRITGLGQYFAGRAFTTSEVENGKPAPDIFHYAAKKLGFTCAEAVVIEDSEMGVRGGLAAGALVWHFRGGSHMKFGHAWPDDVKVDAAFDDMKALYSACHAMGLCQK